MRKLLSMAVAAVLLAAIPAAIPAAAHAATVPASEGNLLISCSLTHTANDDPIKFPGVTGGSGHEHDFFGVLGIDAFTTTASILDQPHSCNFASENVAAWVPSMIWADGTEHAATNLSIYYRKPINSTTPVYPIPIGLRTIRGSATNTDVNKRVANWMCGNGAAQAYIPPAACTSSVLATSYTPQCWNGNELDNAAHSTLVTCDGSPGQIVLPQIQYTATYPPGSGGGNLESDLDAGTTLGRTWHIDYWFAGDPFAWTKVIERCLNAGIQCRVTGPGEAFPQGSVQNISVSPHVVVLSATEAKGINP